MVTASSSPVWNEEISFIEQFPPLAQRIRVQILDDAKMGDVILATHFLDLQQISDPTRNGSPHLVCLFGLALTGMLAPCRFGAIEVRRLATFTECVLLEFQLVFKV